MMKRFLSYSLLCIYATVMVHPVMPSLADAFSHILNYSEHIATVHVENGRQHVHYEYMEAAKKNSDENGAANNLAKKADNSNEHIMNKVSPAIPLSGDVATQTIYFLHYSPQTAISKDLRPPIEFFA